jgi:hypothetical protein
MYFVWETRRNALTEVLIDTFPPVLRDYGVSFLDGRRFIKEVPELEIRATFPKEQALTDDLVIKKRRCLIYSQRLIDVLRSIGVDNIDYHPCRIVNELTGQVLRTHQAANILDMIYCLDQDNSEFEIDDEEPNEIWYVNNLKLLQDRLGDVHIFRLGERPSIVIVDQMVKEAIEAAHLTGVTFLPAEGYRDYQGYAMNNPRNVIGTHDFDPDGPADLVPEEEAEVN